MEEYLIIDQCGNDVFIEYFRTEAEAIAEAQKQFERMTNSDRKRREAFHVMKTANPDKEAPDHLDGDIIVSFIDKKWGY